tara:strand:- start:221 stop:463 length:243 start_codon:yes stop_codon:yes gene_type:complete
MWSCPQGLTGTRHVGTATKCWRYNCPGAKPLPKEYICTAYECNNLIRNVKGAKYCSLKCKSKESSRIYRLKKKNEKRTTN